MCLMDVLKPQKPPEPKNVSFRRIVMKTNGVDDYLTGEQRREKRLEEMRDNYRAKKK